MAVASALRREEAPLQLRAGFDGSIVAPLRFTSRELLDAGFNTGVVAHRQGHGSVVLMKQLRQVPALS